MHRSRSSTKERHRSVVGRRTRNVRVAEVTIARLIGNEVVVAPAPITNCWKAGRNLGFRVNSTHPAMVITSPCEGALRRYRPSGCPGPGCAVDQIGTV